MDRFTRIVLGYHGCEPTFAEALVQGNVALDAWEPSQNTYDWLGHGIYFWEFAPERAITWGGKHSAFGDILKSRDIRTFDIRDILKSRGKTGSQHSGASGNIQQADDY